MLQHGLLILYAALLKIDYKMGDSNPNIGVSYKYFIRQNSTASHRVMHSDNRKIERGASVPRSK